MDMHQLMSEVTAILLSVHRQTITVPQLESILLTGLQAKFPGVVFEIAYDQAGESYTLYWHDDVGTHRAIIPFDSATPPEATPASA